MFKGKIQGKIWPDTVHCCHERWDRDRCKLEKSHTEYTPSKNPLIEQLNGWHQCRSGCWKNGTFMKWPDFEKFRNEMYKEASYGQETEG